MNISFNDSSLDDRFSSQALKKCGQEKFDDFVVMLNKMIKEKLIDDFFLTRDILEYELSKNYTVSNWMNDSEVSSNHQQFFRAFLGRAVYIDGKNLDGQVELYYNDYLLKSIGATFAKEYEDNPIIMSVLIDSFWNIDVVEGIYTSIDISGELEEERCNTKNITICTDISGLKRKQYDDVYKNISSGQDLWEKRETIFPNLIFCNDVKKQFYQDSEKYHIVKVMDRLSNLQKYFQENHERYDPKELGMDARTESETVKTDEKLKSERLFMLPSGEKEYFFDHIGFTGKYTGGRIYFKPDVSKNICYIGYVGRHLPTQKY